MNNSDLEFRKIPSLDFLYEVNSNGTILRNVKSKKQSKIVLDMHHANNGIGYYMTMVSVHGKTKRVMLHAVVAECWHGKRPDGLQIDHIDRNSRNNDYRNLRYVTHSEQMKNRVLSAETIERCKHNCRKYTMECVAIPVEVTNRNTNEKAVYPSMSECARAIADVYGVSGEKIRAKLKQRRKSVYDYDIRYLRNAQTGRVDSTE